MRQSRAFIVTLREAPRDAEVISQQLMIRAGMIRKVAAGIYDYLPLALRSIRKFEQIVRQELNRDGCQELLMPTVQPKELWEESGRWQFYGKELLRFKDRKDAEFCLGPTHEEVITDIVRSAIRSYKQLPVNLYQVQTKFRDEIRPRFGLMRGREFVMKDGYSFHVNDADADREYWLMFDAYKRIFRRLGVKFRPVEADSGAIGGSFTHEFHVLAATGEDAILSCSRCEYTSNSEKTEAPQLPYPHASEPVLDLQRAHFHTPGIVAMEDQARAFRDDTHDGLPLDHASKFYLVRATKGDTTWDVGIVLRSDHEPNFVKVKNLLAADSVELVPVAEAELKAGAKSGFIGPVELNVPTYVDRSLEGAHNLTCGANQDGYHHFGFKPDRDLEAFKGVHDLRMAREGDPCARCARVDTTRTAVSRSVRSSSWAPILGVHVMHVSRRARCGTADGHGVLRHWHHADDCGGHRAELRRGRHHLAVAGSAVSRPRGQPRRRKCRDQRRRGGDRTNPRSRRDRGALRRSGGAQTGSEVQRCRSARHAVASHHRRERIARRGRRAA